MNDLFSILFLYIVRVFKLRIIKLFECVMVFLVSQFLFCVYLLCEMSEIVSYDRVFVDH